MGQSHRRRRLLELVGERLNRHSATPVLVVHEEPREPQASAAPLAAAQARAGAHRLSPPR